MRLTDAEINRILDIIKVGGRFSGTEILNIRADLRGIEINEGERQALAVADFGLTYDTHIQDFCKKMFDLGWPAEVHFTQEQYDIVRYIAVRGCGHFGHDEVGPYCWHEDESERKTIFRPLKEWPGDRQTC